MLSQLKCYHRQGHRFSLRGRFARGCSSEGREAHARVLRQAEPYRSILDGYVRGDR